jgi:hypothetical protein
VRGHLIPIHNVALGSDPIGRETPAFPAWVIHRPRSEVPEMSVMARKTSEPTAGVSERYVEDRRGSTSPPEL